MDRNDIIRMAREADEGFETDTFHEESLVGMDAIERFAALVAAAEREACADEVIDMGNKGWNCYHAADAIRARSEA